MRITVETGVDVPMRDGTMLATDLYLPDAPAPALVQRVPYDKDAAPIRNHSLDVMRAVRAGYAVVVQDVRGRYASGGRFVPFAHEGEDGADALAWVAAQPWCSGPTGMCGGSYFGVTQWLAAMQRPPSLKAIAPHFAPADFRDGWTHRGGAFELGFNLTWAVGSIGVGEVVRRFRAGEATAREVHAQAVLFDRAHELMHRLPPAAIPELLDVAPHYQGWLDGTDPGRVDHSRVAVPALNIGGWHDIFLTGTLANYVAMRDRGARLVVGPWAHGNMTGMFAERLYGAAGGVDGTDLTGVQLRWFDRHLRGATMEDEPRVRIFVTGPDVWRDESDWPLPDTVYMPWYLRAGGRLSRDPPGDERPDMYTYDPRDPVPTVGGATFLPGLPVSANAGPRDQRVLGTRADVLTYQSEPLESASEVTGPIDLVLYASSSAADTDFTAKLVDVHPDGRAEIVTDGILRARHRHPGAPPLEPGAVYELHIAVGATSLVFGEGHRIRLDVSSSNFPRFDRNTNTGGTIPEEDETAMVAAQNVVHHDRRRASFLRLPVIDRR
jgi:putative CocE/NonD family hydrolase